MNDFNWNYNDVNNNSTNDNDDADGNDNGDDDGDDDDGDDGDDNGDDEWLWTWANSLRVTKIQTPTMQNTEDLYLKMTCQHECSINKNKFTYVCHAVASSVWLDWLTCSHFVDCTSFQYLYPWKRSESIISPFAWKSFSLIISSNHGEVMERLIILVNLLETNNQ